jgi:TolB protein
MTSNSHLPSRLLRSFATFVSALLVIGSVTSCGGQTGSPDPSQAPTDFPTATLSPTQAPTQTPYIITATSANATPVVHPQGVFFLAMADSGYMHLFAYSPETLAYTRLTIGECDDTSPALSPDASRLAFSSNCNGYWNLFTLDLSTGDIIQLTDSPEYKGNPSWSADGAYLTYDTFINGSLEIFVKSSTDLSQPAIQLTQDLALDTQPAWIPVLPGRQIAFVSNRSGEPEIWVADLDHAGSYTNISENPSSIESHPAWSPDGTRLAWAATDAVTGLNGIYLWDSRAAETPPQWVASGTWPAWQDDGHLLAALAAPNQSFLTGFDLGGSLTLPPLLLPGPLAGMAYGTLAKPMPGPFHENAALTPAPLFSAGPGPASGSVPGRAALVRLDGLQAIYPKLLETVVSSFQALRSRVALAVGWDALATLENAYIPLTTSLDPGLGSDWLYTGRAFTLNPALVDAGWMVIVREDFGQQAYWRIFLRTTAQDGSQGAPLPEVPWDFSARTGDPSAYENGGRLMLKVPAGYYLDLTTLAAQYGWHRLPALTNWRTYYAGARYNELAYTEGLDWRAAMLQLYPPEVLVTPTVVIPPTRTPTRTPMWWQTPTPTRTPTFRPTNTP